MLFEKMVHCDFENGSKTQHFQGTLLVGREGVTNNSSAYSVYALNNVDNSERPLRRLDQSVVYANIARF